MKARGCPQQGTSRLLHAFAGNDDDEEEEDDDLLDIYTVIPSPAQYQNENRTRSQLEALLNEKFHGTERCY